jgi:DNA-binding YbaB/EbfC family protein
MIPGLEEMMKQAQQMTQKMAQAKQELAKKTVTGKAGGGMVKATANGAGQLIGIEVEAAVANVEDIEMLQDLIVAATNQALEAVKQMTAEHMSKLSGGLPMAGMENLFSGMGL